LCNINHLLTPTPEDKPEHVEFNRTRIIIGFV
jgi:hypothetical protein